MNKIILKPKIYYSRILREWLENRKDLIKESSYNKYLTSITNNINPYLGDINIKKLKDTNIYNYFNTDEIRSLSDSTKKILYIIIRSSIDFSIEKKYIKNFPKLNVKLKAPKHKIIYFTKKEQSIFEKYILDNMSLNNLGLLLALYTGIRIGELCALQWKDVDFINNTISISKTVQRVKNNDKDSNTKTKLVVAPPKTEHSIRIIPVPKFVMDILKKYKGDNEIFIFNNSATPKDTRTFEKYFERVLKKCNIKNINFHSLRHTFATRSRESGMDIKILSELLGHSSYKITLEIYVHTSLDFKKSSVNSLVKYLKPKKVFVELG